MTKGLRRVTYKNRQRGVVLVEGDDGAKAVMSDIDYAICGINPELSVLPVVESLAPEPGNSGRPTLGLKIPLPLGCATPC